MTKWQKINIVCFLFFVFFACGFVYVFEKTSMSTPFEKAWHLQPSVHEDSLSEIYRNEYLVLDKRRLLLQVGDSLRPQLLILVDAWGVPIQERLLQEDFAIFEDIPHTYALHQRLANRTKHAEMVEYRNNQRSNVFLFGGDSLEYNRTTYIKEIGFEKVIFCQYCSDSVMIGKIDSILTVDSLRLIAWTTQSSRTGDRDSLHRTLALVSTFAKSHPNIQIVVQGTHRPILGNPEVRNSYKAHWVPVVILNGRE